MKHAPRIAALILLPIAAAFQASAWYGGRSVLAIHAEALGGTFESYRSFSAGLTLATLCGVVLSVPLAGGTGPLPIAALGLAIAAAALAGAGFVGDLGPYQVCWLLASFGVGLYRAPLYAAAARWFGRGHEGARVAIFALLIVSVNIAAFLAPLATDLLGSGFGHAAIFPVAGAFALVAALVLLVPLAVPLLIPADEDDAPQPVDWRAVGIGVGVAAVAALGFAASTLGKQLDPGTYEGISQLLWSIDPAVAVGTGVVLALAAGGAQLAGYRVPALAVAGVGFLALAASIVVGLVVPGAFGFGLAGALSGFADVLSFAGALAFVTGGLHFRVATAPAAIVAAAAGGGMLIAGPLGQILEETGGAFVAVAMAALVCAVVGVALGAASFALELRGEPEVE